MGVGVIELACSLLSFIFPQVCATVGRVRRARQNLGSWIEVSVGLTPTDKAFHMMLESLIRTFGLKGAGAVLGVPLAVLRGWRNGGRVPGYSARRLVWLVWVSFLHPGRVQNALDLVTWGKLGE